MNKEIKRSFEEYVEHVNDVADTNYETISVESINLTSVLLVLAEQSKRQADALDELAYFVKKIAGRIDTL